MHKKQKATPSDIPSEPSIKQSAEMVQPPCGTQPYLQMSVFVNLW